MEHPLKVYLPMVGKLFLLQWWTHKEQYHVILARSEEKIRSLAEKLFAANADSRINAYLEIELAAPPIKLCEEAARTVRAEAVHDFLRQMSFFLFDLEEAGKPLPTLFVKCDKYETPYEREGEPGEYATKEHWDCTHCVGSFKLVGLSGEEFYDKYYQKWEDDHPKKYHRTGNYVNQDPIPQYSQAPIAADTTDLWMATPDFGHHQPGVDLVQLEPDRVYTNPALFYFRVVNKLDTGALQSIIDNLKTARKQRDIERSLALKKEREQEKQQEIERTLAFFS